MENQIYEHEHPTVGRKVGGMSSAADCKVGRTGSQEMEHQIYPLLFLLWIPIVWSSETPPWMSVASFLTSWAGDPLGDAKKRRTKQRFRKKVRGCRKGGGGGVTRGVS